MLVVDNKLTNITILSSLVQSKMRCREDVNIVVVSDAGKVIFNRFDDDSEEYLCYICGLIQAVRATTINDSSLDHGELQFINANRSKIVFMTIGCITMVAIAEKHVEINEDVIYTEYFLRLQLEYVYTGIIFTLTDNVQHMLHENASLDIREMLGSTIHTLRRFLDGINVYGDMPLISLGGVRIFGPIPSDLRNHISTVLSTTCFRHKSIIYAILSIDTMLLNIVQPHARQYQLRSFDINLLLHYIYSQTQTADNDFWFPICLPTLSQSGFVHCFQCCLGEQNLKLTIISQDPMIEEFHRLRVIANDIRTELGLEENQQSVLRIYNLNGNKELNDEITDEQLIWERTKLVDTTNNEEKTILEMNDVHKKKLGHHVLRSIHKAMDVVYQDNLMQSYCEIASVTHFVFRYSVPIRNYVSGSTSSGGYLSQYYSPSIDLNVKDPVVKRRVMNIYERICLHFRLESTIMQSKMDVLDGINVDDITDLRSGQQKQERLIKSDNGFFYLQGDNELFLGLSGQNYELYSYFNTNVTPSDAYVLCGALVDTLLNDIDDLLLCKPQSF